MIRRVHFMRAFRKQVNSAVSNVAGEYARGGIADENDFTSQMLAMLRSKLDRWSHNGVHVSVATTGPDERSDEGMSIAARRTKSSGPGAEEKMFGADIVIAAKIAFPEYNANKGILVQSKRLNKDDCFHSASWSDLTDQMQRMNKITRHSYVWLYDASGVRSIKSETLERLNPRVLSSNSRYPDDLYTTKIGTFLGEFVQSKHGDHRIKTTRAELLDRLRAEYQTNYAALLGISEEDA